MATVEHVFFDIRVHRRLSVAKRFSLKALDMLSDMKRAIILPTTALLLSYAAQHRFPMT
jgi:hypothetical protein